jgi:glutaredoxin
MKKNSVILSVLGIIAVVAAVVVFSRINYRPPSGIVYFYGDACPHCLNVEKFIEDNKIEDKVSFEKKEVFENEENAMELAGFAQKCRLSAANIGVPFLWDGSKCYVGDTDIINFFKQKAGVGR